MTRKLAAFLMIALTLFASTAMLVPQSQAQATGGSGGLVIPIAGSLPGTIASLPNATSFAGTFTLKSFQVVNGALQAVGTATVNILDGAGNVLATITNANVVGSLLPSSTGSCTILTLDIGAIHLDLLGLVVDLAPIHLNITAQSGPGNLLGNLLCAVANLLNNGGPLSQLANLLNQILGQL